MRVCGISSDATPRRPSGCGALAAGDALALEPIELGVTDDASVTPAVERILAKAGRIVVVVNNAGSLLYEVRGSGLAFVQAAARVVVVKGLVCYAVGAAGPGRQTHG